MVEGEPVPETPAGAGEEGTAAADVTVEDLSVPEIAQEAEEGAQQETTIDIEEDENEEQEQDEDEMTDGHPARETDVEEQPGEGDVAPAEEPEALPTPSPSPSPQPPAPEGERPNANHDYCDCCNEADGSDVLCCDSCPCSFHLACADPPLTRVPDAEAWFCPACTTAALAAATTTPASATAAHDSSANSTSLSARAAVLTQAGPLAPLVARVLAMNPVLYSVPPGVQAGAAGDARAGEHRRRLGRPARRAMECCELPTGDFAQCKICMRRYHIFCLEPPLVAVPLYFECERHVQDDTDAPTGAAAVARRALAAGAPYAGNDCLLQDRVKLDRRLPHLPVLLARDPAAPRLPEPAVADAARAIRQAVVDPRPAAARRAELRAWLAQDAAATAALAQDVSQNAPQEGVPVAGVYADPQHPFVLTHHSAALVELLSQFGAWKDMLRTECEIRRLRKRARTESGLECSGEKEDKDEEMKDDGGEDEEDDSEDEEDDDETTMCFLPSRGDTAMKLKLLKMAQTELAKTLAAEEARQCSDVHPHAHGHAHAQPHRSDGDSDSDVGDGAGARVRRRGAPRRDARQRSSGSSGTQQTGGVKREREREREKEKEKERESTCVIPFRPTHSIPLCPGTAERCPATSAYAHLVYYDPFAEREVILYEMRARPSFVIGRHKASGRPPQVDLKTLFGSDHFRNVSHQHCAIEYRPRTRTFVVTPLSKSGLYCRIPQPAKDSKTMPPLLHINENETREIKSGTVLYLSSFTLPFCFVIPPSFKPPRGV